MTNKQKKIQLLYILSIAYYFMKSFTHKAWYYALVMSFLVACMWYITTTYADLDLYFDLPSSLEWGTFPVSFIWWGNNYAGSLIFNNQTSVTQNVAFTGWITLTCRRQIHGYYFNAARWVGLLPLSSATQMNDGVTVNGGLYTSCGNGVRIYDIVWVLSYRKDGVDIGQVVFWVDTNLPSNSSNGTYQAGAISWKVSNWVNGRFFDTMFGIGNVSSATNGIGVVGTVSNLIGAFTNIYVQWYIGIGQSVERPEREILTVNLAGTKTLLTSNNELLSSDVLNTVSKNTSKQCRDSNTFTYNDVLNATIGTNKFICVDLEWLPWDTFDITDSQFDDLKNKDIVFLNGNVKINRSLYKETNYNNFLSFYIANGNLIFDSTILPADLTAIDNNGFAKHANNTAVTSWVYLVGNFITNWLILWSPNGGVYTNIPFKTFVHGRLVSLNTMTSVSIQREKQLAQVLQSPRVWPSYIELTTTANPYFINNRWNASMGDVFAWKCADISTGGQVAWYGANPVWLFDANTINAVRSIPCPPWHRYPLSIIEKSLPTSFFLK